MFLYDVPVIQLSKKEIKTKSKPWITPAIHISISKKNKLYKNYLKQNLSIIILDSRFIEIR